MLKTSTLLFVSVFFMLLFGVSDYGYGCHKGGNDQKGCEDPPPDPGEGAKCSSEFSVVFGDAIGTGGDPCDGSDGDKVCSDGMGAYIDGVDKVFAGGGGGFRLATNQTGNKKFNFRKLCFDFTGAPNPGGNSLPFVTDCRKADMRIWQDDPDRGRLCDMADGETQSLGFSIKFEVPDAPDDNNMLLFGQSTSFGSLERCGETLEVTRESDTTWVFTNIERILDTEGTARACLKEPGNTLLDDEDNLQMPFTMTITAIP